MALGRTAPVPDGLIHHSDKGPQLTSNDYIAFCHTRQMRPSVGRTGVCWDNAVAESFWNPSSATASKNESSRPAPRPAG